MNNIFFYQSPIGKISISDNGTAITSIDLSDNTTLTNHVIHETALIRNAANQLQEYFKGERKVFDLPLAPPGTKFQKQVWRKLLEIPYGETKTYKDIAIAINNPKAYRAVGMANNKNPIFIVIPCHRVIGKNGMLVGYSGGLHIKDFLLNLEKSHKK